jgi:outer membrane protein TolC
MMSGKLCAAALVLFTLGAGLFAQAVTPASPQGAAVQGAPPQTGAQDTAITLTLEQVVARAIANQPLILQAEAAVEAARARVGQAQSAYYPNVSAAASYTLLEPDQSIAFPGLGNFSLVPINNWDFNVGLRQVIFQFGKRGVQVKLAENGVSAARIGVDQIRISLAFQAAQGFYTVLFLQEQLKALNEQLQNLQEHLSATQVKEQTGSATRYDELSTGVRISVLQSQLIEAENQYQKQSIALKQLLGMAESADFRPSGGFTPASDDPPDEQSQLASAMAHRPDVLQAVETESAAELNRSLATMGAWPTISAHAAMGYKNGILTSRNLDINALVFDWVAGIQVSVPIFQGFLIARQGEEADKKLLAARENTLAVKRNVTTQVLQALQDADASRQQVQSAQSQLNQATEMLQVVKLQYDLGMLSNLEYLDAQAALERAQLGSLQAQYRAVLSELAVKQAIGAVIWETTP